MSARRAAILASLLVAAMPALARDYAAGPLKIGQPWSRAVPDAAQVAGAYLTVTNTGSAPDRLIGATAAMAGKVEIHEMSMSGGVMKMRELPAGLEIKPGETVILKPGSFHLMFLSINQRPKAGALIKGTLVFEKAGKIDVEFKIEPPGAAGPAKDHAH